MVACDGGDGGASAEAAGVVADGWATEAWLEGRGESAGAQEGDEEGCEMHDWGWGRGLYYYII